MNTAMAIAATTRALRDVVQDATGGLSPMAHATSKPPDEAQKDDGNRVNIFLYHATTNAAWRNRDAPSSARAGESSKPLLPLNLYYLVTAYGENDDDVSAHVLLGHVMRRLHSQPSLPLTDRDLLLQKQLEPIRITLQPLTLDEVSKLWSSFQTPYRPSAMYELAPVLIDHEQPNAVPLPVLQRGQADRGWDVGVTPLPVIEAFQYLPKRELDEIVAGRRPLPSREFAKRSFGVSLLGGLLLRGQNLTRQGAVTAEFRHLAAAETIDGRRTSLVNTIEPVKVSSEALLFDFSNRPPQAWPAGAYTVCLRYASSSDPVQFTNSLLYTNSLTVALVPRITRIRRVGTSELGVYRLSVALAPPIRNDQQAVVLVGDREFSPFSRMPNEVIVELPAPFPPTDTYARLRVDGVDSLLFDADGAVNAPPQYEETFLVRKPPE
jgi:hypothetical protein